MAKNIVYRIAAVSVMMIGCNAILGIEDPILLPSDGGNTGGASTTGGSPTGGAMTGGTATGGATTGGAGPTGGSASGGAASGGSQGGTSGGISGGTTGGAAPSLCDPNETPDSTNGIFVDPMNGNDAWNGQMGTPTKTIQAALSAISGSRKHLYLHTGTHAGPVSIGVSGSGAILDGGWVRPNGQKGWVRECTKTGELPPTLLASTSASGMKIANATEEVLIKHLTIQTVPAPSADPNKTGNSTIGVAVLQAKARLVGVHVLPGTGGRGGEVTDVPPKPAAGSACTSTTTCCNPAQGVCGPTAPAPTAPATAAGAAVPGAFGVTGFVPADGASGIAGSRGVYGSLGQRGKLERCVSNANAACGQCVVPGGEQWGTCNNKGTEVPQDIWGGYGKCGCGGLGGTGGIGGKGGGASLGILLTGNSELNLVGTTIVAANGGDGNDGGLGGVGGDGYDGAVGDPGLCQTCHGSCTNTCINTSIVAGGTAGTKGSSGGRGGRGGGGAGGSSVGIVRQNSAALTLDAWTMIRLGKPGSGAAGAVSGAAKDILVIP